MCSAGPDHLTIAVGSPTEVFRWSREVPSPRLFENLMLALMMVILVPLWMLVLRGWLEIVVDLALNLRYHCGTSRLKFHLNFAGCEGGGEGTMEERKLLLLVLEILPMLSLKTGQEIG